LANVYGPGDNFDPNHSHVLGALIAKFVEAKKLNHKRVSIWGAGLAVRDFVFVDDVSKSICKMLKNDNLKNKIINITSGEKVSIKQLVYLIKKITKFSGKVIWDKSKPEGIKFKALSDKRMKYYNLNSSINLENGIKKTIDWYKKKY